MVRKIDGLMWLAVNANKRNIALDLKKPEAVEIVKRLVKDADIVMENYRAGVMDRLGIGYDALTEVNPTLIYCAISRFGALAPEKNTPGLRWADTGNFRHHVDHRHAGDRPHASARFPRLRRDRRSDRGLR